MPRLLRTVGCAVGPRFRASNLLLITLVFCTGTALPGRAAGTPTPRTYSIGVLDDNPPFSFRDTDGRIKGFAVDMLAAVEKTTGLQFERRTGPTDEIHRLFDEGALDMLQSYVPNDERRRRWAFSTPYLRLTGVIFVRRGESRITSIDHLRGRTVAVHAGSVGAKLLRDEGLADSILIARSVEDALTRVDRGEADATLASRLTGLETIRRLGLRHVVPVGESIPGYTVNYCFAMKQGPEYEELRTRIDEALLRMEMAGPSGISPRQEIYDAWFAFADPRRFDATQIALAVSSGLALALLIALWAMLRQRRLHHEIARQADALRVSEEGYRTVFEATLHGLIVFERLPAPADRWVIAQLNPAARRILGEPATRASRSAFGEAYPADATLGARLAEALDSPAPAPFEHDRSRPEAPSWVDVVVSRLGESRRLVAIRDITEARVAAERLRRSEAQLRQNQKLEAIGTLASGVAHDFNNVLTAILGNIELLRLDLAGSDTTMSSLQEMREAAERARFLVRQILTFSRRTETRREVLQATRVIKETLRFVSATAPSTIEWRHHVCEPSPCIEIDPTQLHQVLMNLCTNAVHALRGRTGLIEIAEESVEVQAGAPEHPTDLKPGLHLVISVRDTGAGMPPDVLNRIFEPFFTTKPSGEGTGLGLAVVHGIVTGCGGAVSVASTPNHGTTFRLYFPASTKMPPTAPVEDPAAPAGRGEHVLFVDDEPAIVQAASRLLERLGYRVAGFTRPTDALEAFARQPGLFDVVITDLTMPELSGLELAARLRARRPDLPVVLISGFVNERERALARAARITRVVDKPLTQAGLGQAVAAGLASRRA